jgi:hypothetical protein
MVKVLKCSMAILAKTWARHCCGGKPVVNTLLAVLKVSGASYLITGDKDLLALSDRYPIVTPAVFWLAHAGI